MQFIKWFVLQLIIGTITMEDDETLILLPPKCFKVTNWSKCVTCQDDTGETIRKGTEAGINLFTTACRQ